MTTPAILQTWLWYANIGVPIVPEHTPDPKSATRCDCRKADCKKPAKHPRTAKGSLAATTDPAQLERWAGMWPHANTGTDAGLANLVIVAPDSPEWDAEFRRRGLDGAAIAQTGGGEGHRQYWFRRSAGCPQARLCKPEQYDILSNGNVVIPGSLHVSGNRYAWIESPVSIADLPEEPAWVRDMLLQAKRSTPVAAELDEDPDAPPVRYHSERARQRWRGELIEPKRRKDGQAIPGTVDRSESLFYIGLDLAEANAGARTIVQALEERDRALGWNVFADRKDAATRYGEIAGKAIDYAERKKAEAGGGDGLAAGNPTAGSCPDCPCCGRLKTIEAALGNDALAPAARIVTIGAILELDGRKDWKRPSKIEQATEAPDGFRIVSRERLSKRVGLSTAAVGRHLKVAVKAGLLRQKVVGLPAGHPDVVTGEIINEPRRYTALATVGSPDDALTAAGTVTVEHPAWRRPDRRQGTCAKHPLAGTYEKVRRTIHCDVCGDILQSEQLVPTGATPPAYTSVATTQVQLVPTGAKAAAARHRAYKAADDQADSANARELADAFARLYARAAPVPDETAPDPPANGHAPSVPPPVNGSTNGHHPQPPPVEPRRATPLEAIEFLHVKFGSPPPPTHTQEGEHRSL